MKNTTQSALTILGTFLVIGVVSSAGLHLKDAVSASLKVDGRKDDGRSIAQKYAAELHNHTHKFDMKHHMSLVNQGFAVDIQTMRKKAVGNKRLQFELN